MTSFIIGRPLSTRIERRVSLPLSDVWGRLYVVCERLVLLFEDDEEEEEEEVVAIVSDFDEVRSRILASRDLLMSSRSIISVVLSMIFSFSNLELSSFDDDDLFAVLFRIKNR